MLIILIYKIKKFTEFAEEMKFDIKNTGLKSPRDSSIVKLLKSPPIMASATSTKFISSDPNELCDRIKLLLQEKRAGYNSNIFNGEIVAIIDKFLECKSINPSDHKKIFEEL